MIYVMSDIHGNLERFEVNYATDKPQRGRHAVYSWRCY